MAPVNTTKKVAFSEGTLPGPPSPSDTADESSESTTDLGIELPAEPTTIQSEGRPFSAATTTSLNLVDLPPVPSVARTDDLKSTLTIFTPGEQVIHVPNLNTGKRRSCDWSQSNLPCIHKAISNLVHLQKILAKVSPSTPVEEILLTQEYLTVSSFPTQNNGLDIIKEIRELIERLEADRTNTIRALQREEKRVEELKLQVHRVEQQRQAILPKVIQAEHQIYWKGITETKKELEEVKEVRDMWLKRVAAAREKHREMTNSVNELKDQCPRIKDKIESDKEDLKDVSVQLKEAKKELQKVNEEMNEAHNKSSLADGRAEQERKELREELEGIKKTLEAAQDELQEAVAEGEVLEREQSRINGLINDVNEIGKDLDKKILEAGDAEKRAYEEVNDSKTGLLEISENIRARRRSNDRLNEVMAQKHLYIKSELDIRDKKKQRQLRLDKTRLREALQNTVKMEREIIDFKKELIVSIKKAREDEKATLRAQTELKHLDHQLKIVVEEVQKLASMNSKLNQNAHKTEEDIVNTENALRNSLSGLRKELQDEMKAKTILSQKMAVEAEDFEKFQKVSSKKREKTAIKKDELEVIHKKYSSAKEKLVKKHNKILNERDKLLASIDKTKKMFAAEKARLEKEISALVPEDKAVKKELEETQKEIDDLSWRSSLISKKIQETLDATKVVTKIQKQTNDSIIQLEQQIIQFEIDLEEGQRKESQLQANWDHIKDNQLLLRNQHKAALEKRMVLFKELKEQAEELVQDNAIISTSYHELQSEQVNAKAQYQKTLERRLSLEQNFKQSNAITQLQKRMHKALISYYMHRGYHNRIVLTDFGKGAAVNLHHIEKIHRNLCDVLSKTDVYIEKHGSGVVRQQPRIPSVEIPKAMTDIARLPVNIETPPPLRPLPDIVSAGTSEREP